MSSFGQNTKNSLDQKETYNVFSREYELEELG